MSVFGNAKYGSNKRTFFKLKDGDSVYRILPPMGDCADEGIWSKFYAIHYGYKNSAGQIRTFQSCESKNSKTKMIEVSDAALERIQKLTAELETARKNKDEKKVTQLLKLVGGQNSRYNLDKNQYMNVVDLQGNIGILKIRYKAKLALQATIDKLRAEGTDPLSPDQGRFFVFNRSGKARDTTYQVTVYKKKLKVEGVGEVEQDVIHSIDDAFARRCVVKTENGFSYKEAANLLNLFKKPSEKDVKRIVLEGETAVDEILDGKLASGDTSEDDSGSEDETSTTQDTQTTSVGANQTDPTVSAALKAGIQGTPTGQGQANQTTATTVAAEAPKTTAETVGEQSDADFLKSLGL